MSAVNKHVDVTRLRADLASAAVELLSAHCAADRVRLQYSPHDIVTYGETQALRRAISSARALNNFFSVIHDHMEHGEERARK